MRASGSNRRRRPPASRIGGFRAMGELDLMKMWHDMGWVAKGVAYILFFMSFWSVGVAVERIYTFSQARKQSKLYAPQVAKHLKEGRLKDAIAVSQSKQY